jgi:thiamine biosynthesis protein ThiS
MTQTEARESTVALTVNGDRREIPRGFTLSDLLESLGLDPRMIVVEHNRGILRDRDAYPRIDLNDGDSLELVHFVGGG